MQEAPCDIASSEPAAPAVAPLPGDRPTAAMASSLAALALAACGGGGGGGGGSTSAPSVGTSAGSSAPAQTAPANSAEAARFLHQASLAASDADIQSLTQQGYSVWLDQQFALRPSQTNFSWLTTNGYAAIANQYSTAGTDGMAWRALISEANPVVQRLALMWSEIFVIGAGSLTIAWPQFAAAAYLDLLTEHATGNFRDLLKAVTLSAAMGNFLSLQGSKKANAATNVHPDENFAREVMQLMTIGLVQLNPDGTVVTSNGAPVPTYGQEDVTGLAAAFTGWQYSASSNSTTPGYTQAPMVQNAANHTTTASTFLGVTIPAGTSGEQALETILDTLVQHPNTAPFIARHVIQRLVTSNPSAAYVARVASVFVNDGHGTRGNLASVVKAALLDSEARTPPAGSAGRLREPMLRLVQWARTFGASSAGGLWTIGDTSDAASRLGQSPLRSPTVFNFFAPDYAPPGTPIASQGLVSPEFQLLDESTAAGYLNYMQSVISRGAGDVTSPYTDELVLSVDAAGLVARLNLLLAADQLDSSAVSLITSTVAAMPSATTANLQARVHAAVFLIMATPSYQVLK